MSAMTLDEIAEFAIDLAEFGRLMWKRAAKTRTNLIRDRLPHGAFSNVLDIIENIVEHAVSLDSEALPIRRVKRRACVGWWVHAHVLTVTLVGGRAPIEAMRALAVPALYFAVLLEPCLLSATQFTGSVRAADQWIPGATITASQGGAGNTKLVAYTDDAGSYTLDLAPGVWNIQVEMFGFAAVNCVGFVMFATVIQCVCTPSTQFTATGV